MSRLGFCYLERINLPEQYPPFVAVIIKFYRKFSLTFRLEDWWRGLEPANPAVVTSPAVRSVNQNLNELM